MRITLNFVNKRIHCFYKFNATTICSSKYYNTIIRSIYVLHFENMVRLLTVRLILQINGNCPIMNVFL